MELRLILWVLVPKKRQQAPELGFPSRSRGKIPP